MESDSCCCFASGHRYSLDAWNVMMNKLQAKQCRRYMQPSNKDEFEFSDSPPTSINKRTRLRASSYCPRDYPNHYLSGYLSVSTSIFLYRWAIHRVIDNNLASIYWVLISNFTLRFILCTSVSANIVCILIWHFKYIRRLRQRAITSSKSHGQTSSTQVLYTCTSLRKYLHSYYRNVLCIIRIRHFEISLKWLLIFIDNKYVLL